MGDIQTALGLGEDFPLRNGGSLKVYPCTVADLEDLAPMYDKFVQKTIYGCFLPGNEANKEAFYKLLVLANGQRDVYEDERKRSSAAKAILQNFTLDDGGDEVYKYLRRFLGLIPRVAASTETQAEETAV